jgi:signal transduction histidine kinase
MSHELRTPMNAVIGFTEMIRTEVFGPVGSPKYQEYLRDIAASGQHLLHVVNNILDLAKVEAGKWEMEETVSDLRELCEATAQMVRERARSAEVALSVSPSGPSLSIRADRRLMHQILINLLTNGIKFTERGGRVTLWWALNDDGGVALGVTDTGVGMTEDDRRSVLEPFGRGSAELARARHDTGLGLSICRQFAEMHGGRMAIESTLGKGTTVTVTLPRDRVIEAAAATVAAA